MSPTPIKVTTQPISASAPLEATDVTAIFEAIAPLLADLPSGDNTLASCTNLSISIQPSGVGILNLRFSK